MIWSMVPRVFNRRMRRVLGTILALSAVSRATGQAPSTTQKPVFPSGVDVVTVDVVVLDRHGNPVQGLNQADFTVSEDGRPQRLTAFQAVTLEQSPTAPRGLQRVSTNATTAAELTGRWLFVVFDDVNISQFSTPRARDLLLQFADRVLRPGDQVLMALASGGAWWSGTLPEDRNSLVAFVNRFQGARRLDTSAGRLWDHEAMAIALGRDRQMLAQVARRYFENNLIPEAYPVDQPLRADLDVSPGIGLIQAKAREAYTDATARLKVSLGTIERLSAALAGARGRKTLLLVSEGFIMDPSQREFRTLVQSARNSNAAVHFVDVRDPAGLLGQAGLPGASAEFGAAVDERDSTTALAFAEREADGARSIAHATGGRIVSGVNLIDGLTKIAAETGTYYLLGYSPTNKKRDGAFRKIEVYVNRPDVEVRARGGYYAASDRDTPRPSRDKLDPSVRAALDAPFAAASGIPLRLTSYVFEARPDGKVQTLLLAEADPNPLRLSTKAGAYSAVLESYVVVNGRDSGEVLRDERRVELEMPPAVFEQARQTGVPIRREFLLAPGRYQATLLVRERATGLLGSVKHVFDVPSSGEFRVSTPVITDTIEPAVLAEPARPVPIARRTFNAGSRLFCAFDIYGAAQKGRESAPQVSLAYSLRRADGTEVTSAPPQRLRSNARGQVSVMVALTLPEAASGEHELHLTVHDEVALKTITAREPLTIAPRQSR